jgi:hypothetical protein
MQHTAILGLDYQWIDYTDTGAFDFSAQVPTLDIFSPVYDVSYPVPAPTIREHFVGKQTGLYLQDIVRIFGPPAVIGLVTAVGLLSALLGDGAWDVLWVSLDVPLAVIAWCGVRSTRAARKP